jgi:16S rRNA (cytidine1402-2'-O)-methyltransferase
MTNTSFAPAALYIVATPLGNLGDITRRAVDCLAAADAIACEDTRHARRLLDHLGVTAPTFALHEHNEAEATEKLIALLTAGKRVALISDAGTPGISDPGARAVAAARAAGHAVVPLPGANAAIAAMSVAGLTDEQFLFVGFLPAKPGARRTAIENVMDIPAALVFYEAPHRIAETVDDLAALLEPQRTLVVARELTKLFEQIVAMPIGDAPAWLAADENHRRGEFVVVVSAPPPRLGLAASDERTLRTLLAELPLKQAVKLAAEITGAARNELYERALALKGLAE